MPTQELSILAGDKEMSNEKLEPCYFTKHDVVIEKGEPEYTIECKFCGYSMSSEDKEGLIKEWNRQAK